MAEIQNANKSMRELAESCLAFAQNQYKLKETRLIIEASYRLTILQEHASITPTLIHHKSSSPLFNTKANIIQIVACCAFFMPLPSLAVDVVKANIGESTLDQRISFKQEVLRRALEATRESYGEYEIEIHNYYMNAKRAFNELVPGETINVYYALTLPKWEKITTPIRIPVRRGLVSYRLLLIHEDSKELFAKVNTIEELKRLRAGLNDGWTSYEVMKRQDFKIVKVGGYDGMFNMLSVRRYDYLLRGVNEIFDEIDARQDYNKNLVIEPTLAVYIPSATYIFVSKQEPRLAKRLKEGLEIMVASGELERIFSKYYAANLEKAQLAKRKILYIDNPLLPDTVPWENKELWMPHPSSEQSEQKQDINEEFEDQDTMGSSGAAQTSP